MKKAIRFTAKWCGPCKAYAPIFDKVLEETSEWESVVIDVDENSEMAKEYNVRSIPMTILEVDGNIVNKKTGLVKETDLSNLLT
jgi:thioredoxin 1